MVLLVGFFDRLILSSQNAFDESTYLISISLLLPSKQIVLIIVSSGGELQPGPGIRIFCGLPSLFKMVLCVNFNVSPSNSISDVRHLEYTF